MIINSFDFESRTEHTASALASNLYYPCYSIFGALDPELFIHHPPCLSGCRNLNYWDSVSTLAGEVPMPHKTFPRALFGAVVLVVLTYALPLMVGLGVTTVVKDWKLGYFAFIAKKVAFAVLRTPADVEFFL